MREVLALLRDERGTETIQFVLWVPIFVFLLVIVTDASFLYLTNSEMYGVAHDTARRMAAGQLTSETEAVDYASNQLRMFDVTYQIDATYDPNGRMQVFIVVPIVDAMVFGRFLGSALDWDLAAHVTTRAEPELTGGGGASS